MRMLLLVLALIASALALKPATTVAADDAVIAIDASDFAFSPNKITLHVGTPTTLRLESKEGVHGFASPELGIDTTLLRPNHPVTFTVVATTVQEFMVHCAHVCGLGHDGMQLAVDVVP